MNDNSKEQEITLLCKQVDPTDPSKLSCRILRKPASSNEGSAPEASKIPSPDQTESVMAKPSSDISGDAWDQGYETINVRKVQQGKEVVFEVIEPNEVPGPKAKDTSSVQGAQPNLTEMKHRLARSNGCDNKHCVISRLTLLRQHKPANREGNEGEGE